MRQGKVLNQRMDKLYAGYRQSKRQQAKGQFLFNVGATLLICSAVLLTSNITVLASISAATGAAFWLFSWRAYRR